MTKKNQKSALVSLVAAITILSFSSCNRKADDNTALLDSIQISKQMPPWAKAANIYEVNVRQFTPEGTFAAFQQHLPRLKAMGVDILWLMPINPIGEKNRKGSLGSYYSIRDYQAVNPEFGTLDDFKNLVKEAHKLGMKIIIDWVANHTAWDHPWIISNPGFHTRDSLGNVIMPAGTDWSDTADLNYDDAGLRRAMIDALLFWVKEADVDGFRCDVAGMIPLSFWLHARKEIDAAKPGCFFLAEDSEPPVHAAFDMSYSWPLKDVINQVAQGKKNASDIASLMQEEATRFKPDDLRMLFITNHDENTWSGTEYERLGNDKVDVFNALIYLLPGMPLTYTGQEEPMLKRLRFFDKDTVGFNRYERAELLTQLNKLKKDNKALWNISYGGSLSILKNDSPAEILCLLREKDENKVLGVFNMSGKTVKFKTETELVGNFNPVLGDKIGLTKGDAITLQPWSYTILTDN